MALEADAPDAGPLPPSVDAAGRAVRWLLLGSFLALAVVDATLLEPPLASLEACSDQQAHMASALAFPQLGVGLWRQPVRELAREEGEGFRVDGVARALHFNWTELPRPYPPGAFLYAAPEALLAATTSLGQTTLNRLSNLKYLVVTHALLWLLWGLFRDAARGLRRRLAVAAWLAASAVALTLLWAELNRWALSGIYDSASIALVVLSARWARGRPSRGLLAWAGAVFLHFRALWFLPLLGLTVARCVAGWRTFGRRERLEVATAVVLLAAAGAVLALVFPWLRLFPENNPLHTRPPVAWGMASALLVAMAWAAWRREWLFGACAAWQGVMVALTPQTMFWHALFLLPLLSLGARPNRRLLVVAFALYFVESTVVYGDRPQPRRLYQPIYRLLNARAQGDAPRADGARSAAMNLDDLRERVRAAFADREKLKEPLYSVAVKETVALLDRGAIRVASKGPAGWEVNAWAKEAILLYFAVSELKTMELPPFEWHDKVPLKRGLAEAGVRLVPPGVVRYGAFVERGAVVMPGYVNIGAWVGAGTMVDTWATVGSCAQVGRNVHLSGGVGLGGVLEPPSASPVIVEDGAFIGSRCVIVEGVVVEEEAVVGANTVLTASTQIIDVTGDEEVVHKGRVPARSVVIPGVRPRKFPAGEYGVPCALIIGKRNAATDQKTSLNQVLRDFAVPV